MPIEQIFEKFPDILESELVTQFALSNASSADFWEIPRRLQHLPHMSWQIKILESHSSTESTI